MYFCAAFPHNPSHFKEKKILESDILDGAFNFSLVFVLELVLVAHHQVGVRYTQLEEGDNGRPKKKETTSLSPPNFSYSTKRIQHNDNKWQCVCIFTNICL